CLVHDRACGLSLRPWYKRGHRQLTLLRDLNRSRGVVFTKLRQERGINRALLREDEDLLIALDSLAGLRSRQPIDGALIQVERLEPLLHEPNFGIATWHGRSRVLANQRGNVDR